MEVPPLVLLYAVLIAAGVGSMLYMFQVYDGAVAQMNAAACGELQSLAEAAVQRALYEPGNYTATIKTTYVLVVESGSLVVGRDTRAPAACDLGHLCGDSGKYGAENCAVLSSTGTDLVVEKKVVGYRECSGQLPAPRYVKEGDRLYVTTQCNGQEEVEDFEVYVYAK